MLVKDLAVFLDAPFEGDGDCDIRGVAALEDAGVHDLSFVTRGRTAKLAPGSAAGCLLVALDFEKPTGRTVM